jgi:hypothetical protein
VIGMGAVSGYGKIVFRQAKAIVEEAGGHCHMEAGTGAHPKLVIEGWGQVRKTPVSVSPRDKGNAVKMKLCDVRRILREMQPV